MKYTRKYQKGGKLMPIYKDAWDDYRTYLKSYNVNDFGLSVADAEKLSVRELKQKGIDLDSNGIKYRNAYIAQRLKEFDPKRKVETKYRTIGTNPHATYPEFKRQPEDRPMLKRKWYGITLPTLPYRAGFYPRPNKDWGGALTGASTGTKMGVSIGSIFGPIGGLVGGGIGAIAGGLFGNRAENKRIRAQKKVDVALKLEEDKAKEESERLRKKQLYENDANYLNNLDLVESDSMFMKKGGWIQKANASIKRRGTKGVCTGSKFGGPSCRPGTRRYTLAKTFKKMAKNRAEGGQIAANGKTLEDGNKLLTLNGSTRGSHETGQNIPLKKKGRVIAYAEPGEVLVNDKDMPMTPFVLSKRIGRNGTSFAEEFLNLERMKNRYNKNIIEDRQADIIRNNNKFAEKGIRAANGIRLPDENNPYLLGNVNVFANRKNIGFPISIGKLSSYKSPGLQKSNITTKNKRAGNIFGDLRNSFNEDEGNGTNDLFSTFGDITGTVGNLLMTNKTLKRQRDLINDSLTRALNYNPIYNKNYLLNDQIDVSDQTSVINQGYASSISNLNQIDPAIASALKNTANMSRIQNLNSVYGERNRQRIGLRNQNTMNIMANNAANTDLTNQTSLMKLNARIAVNEQLGDLEAARLSNMQGAISDYNMIQRDRQALDSLRARWKDSIGRDAEGNFKCGGKVKKRKRTMKY